MPDSIRDWIQTQTADSQVPINNSIASLQYPVLTPASTEHKNSYHFKKQLIKA